MEPVCYTQRVQSTSTYPDADLAEGAESGLHLQTTVSDQIRAH